MAEAGVRIGLLGATGALGGEVLPDVGRRGDAVVEVVLLEDLPQPDGKDVSKHIPVDAAEHVAGDQAVFTAVLGGRRQGDLTLG